MFYRRVSLAWTQNGVDKIDIRKSIIPRTERVTNPSLNCVPKFCLCVCVLLHYTTLAGSAEALRLPSKQLCAAVRCCALRKLLRHARLVQNTNNRAGSAYVNGKSVRCMDAAWREADGSSTQQPKLYDCRRSSTSSDGFTTNVACRRRIRSSALHHTNLLRIFCAMQALRCTTQTY